MTDRAALPGAAPKRAPDLETVLVFAALALVLIVVVTSAYLRLAGSGLGCADWPACYGMIRAAGGATALGAAPLVLPWARMAHRLAASTLGLLVLGIVASALRQRRARSQGLAIPFALLALTVMLALLGYRTPSPLTPWVATANLLGGMTMLALLWWLGQRSVSAGVLGDGVHRLRPWAFLGILVVFFQIVLGGWVSANFAALSCTDLPGCGGFPWRDGPWRESFDLARTLPVTDGGAVIAGDTGKLIQLAHRAAAVPVLLYLGWLGARAAAAGATRATGVAMLALLVLQVLLGSAAVAFGLPLAVVTLHNAVAALLLLSAVNLFRLLTPRSHQDDQQRQGRQEK
jgi:cytochrome c oxidase assembly protein subunit 15